jgi:DNA-binding FadR family transcriptional regulator
MLHQWQIGPLFIVSSLAPDCGLSNLPPDLAGKLPGGLALSRDWSILVQYALIRRPSLAQAKSADELFDTLVRRIKSGDWAAGARMPTERELASHYEAARNTVRRALRRLEEQGLIDRSVGRGTFVLGGRESTGMAFRRRIASASPADIMEVRLIIEPQVAALAAHRASDADLTRIEAALRESLVAKGLAEFEHWDGDLHLAIICAARNELLIDQCRAINSVRNQPAWNKLKQRTLTPDRRNQYDKQHTRLVSALRERDAAAAQGIMREHLLMISEQMSQALQA